MLVSSPLEFPPDTVPTLRKGKGTMVRKSGLIILGLFLSGILLSGCPKRMVRLPPIEAPPVENPMDRILEAFSAAESVQARVSIRIETVRRGEEIKFLLNGTLLYQKPDKLRLLGYHPLGIGLFDALYRGGEFLVLVPPQKRAYTGQISELHDLIEQAGGIQISSEKDQSDIPNRIRIEIREKETRMDLRLRDVSTNPLLPEDSFQWRIPQGIELKPLPQLLKEKRDSL